MLRRAVVALLLAACLSGLLGQSASASTVSVVSIGGRHYLTGNLQALGRKLVKTTAMRYVLDLVEQCRGVQVHGFVSSGGFGLTASVPLSSPGCLETPNGGPGGSVGGPCLQGFETPYEPDPTGISGLPGGEPRYYVMFAGTSSTVCADISTQVPGGVWGRTAAAVPGLPAGSTELVKCQLNTPNGLADYLGQRTSSLPASKSTYWIYDSYFETNSTARLAGVPECSGVDVALP
jgi:hypothetical protein